MSAERFTILYHKYVSETLTVEELREWKELFDNESYAGLFNELLAETASHDLSHLGAEVPDPHKLFATITKKPATIRRMNTAWLKYAAILLLVMTGAFYFWNKEAAPAKNSVNTKSAASDGAVLILADGTIINLDSAAEGRVINSVEKTADGQITYALSSTAGDPASMNTIQTPAGKQYQVRLPDGSRVWLNAHSSITLPTAFPTNKRNVSIKGEVYFEVTHDESRPFTVDLGAGRSVQVLGTSFNVNNYEDEPFSKTTLITGSVRVRSANDSLILKENQTVNIAATLRLDSTANPMQQVAWKNGIFNFDGTDTRALLRQVARWYDVTIVYEGAVPNKVFEGKLGRDLSLTQMMKVLNDFGIHNRLNGKRLMIQ